MILCLLTELAIPGWLLYKHILFFFFGKYSAINEIFRKSFEMSENLSETSLRFPSRLPSNRWNSLVVSGIVQNPRTASKSSARIFANWWCVIFGTMLGSKGSNLDYCVANGLIQIWYCIENYIYTSQHRCRITSEFIAIFREIREGNAEPRTKAMDSTMIIISWRLRFISTCAIDFCNLP